MRKETETLIENVGSMSLSAIGEAVSGLGPPYPKRLLSALEEDGRSGVRRLACRLRSRACAEEQVRRRIDEMLHYERHARAEGFTVIAGVDEVGRGPLAGPVVASAAILPPETGWPEVNDSKVLSEAQRRRAFGIIAATADIGIGVVSVEEIDRINIQKANLLAIKLAIEDLARAPDLVLIDGRLTAGLAVPQRAVVKGDRRSMSIAAASIVAKVVRDRMMLEFDRKYPQYKFAKHKGYGTAEHLALIKTFGICSIHRRSFAPITECLQQRLL